MVKAKQQSVLSTMPDRSGAKAFFSWQLFVGQKKSISGKRAIGNSMCEHSQCEHTVDGAKSLKRLHLLCLDIPNEMLNVAVKMHPLLEDLELVYVNTPSEDMLKSVCQACPHLKKLKLSFSASRYHNCGVDEELVLEIIDGEIPMMLNLQSLELFECDLTTKGLTAVLDNCPIYTTISTWLF